MEHVKLDNRGVSMTEMLVAMVILMFVSLAMMQVALVSIESNTKNLLRDEGTRLAERSVNQLRNLSTSERRGLLETAPEKTFEVPVTVRKNPVTYTVVNSIADAGSNYKKVSVFVQWEWKAVMYNTTVTSLME